MGVKALRSNGIKNIDFNKEKQQPIPPLKALTQGFITNVFNPKATLFFLAMFSQFINEGDSKWVYVIYGGVCFTLVTVWFSLVSVFLTVESIRNKFLSISKWVDRVCGTLFIALGIKLAITKN
jgi:threonine/homoserine/homoserine lactone efflux protein